MTFVLHQRVRSASELGTVDMVGLGAHGPKVHVTFDDGSTAFYTGRSLYLIDPIEQD